MPHSATKLQIKIDIYKYINQKNNGPPAVKLPGKLKLSITRQRKTDSSDLILREKVEFANQKNFIKIIA